MSAKRNPLSQINFFVWEGHYRRGTLSPLCLRAPFLSPGGFGNNLAVNSPYNSSRLSVNLYNARFIMAYNGVSSDISHEFTSVRSPRNLFSCQVWIRAGNFSRVGVDKRVLHAMIPGVMEGIILCDRLFVISRSLAFSMYTHLFHWIDLYQLIRKEV